MIVFQHESFPLLEKRLVISAPLNEWNAGNATSLTLPRALASSQSHEGYLRTSDKPCLHTDSDSALQAELKYICLENGYEALLHRWQLRPGHVGTSWCLLLLDYFEDGSHFDELHDTGIPRPQKLLDSMI